MSVVERCWGDVYYADGHGLLDMGMDQQTHVVCAFIFCGHISCFIARPVDKPSVVMPVVAFSCHLGAALHSRPSSTSVDVF